MSLLGLPRELLEYILGEVIYDHFVRYYVRARDPLTSICKPMGIEREIYTSLMCTPERFISKYSKSSMSCYMLQLSKVHPRFRQVLMENTVLYDSNKRWGFKDKLFYHQL